MSGPEARPTLADGKVLVEVSSGTVARRGEEYSGGALQRAVAAVAAVDLGTLLTNLDSVVTAVADTFAPRDGGPASCEVKFGVKVGADGNVILAKMGTELNLEVKLTWTR